MQQLKRMFRAATRAAGIEIQRYRPEFRRACVSLRPEKAPIGNVLIAYILAPFLRRPGESLSTAHTHHLESVLMARVWLELGFAVDVIDYRDADFQPRKRYDFFVSARTHLATIAPRLNADCVKIAHFDTSHYAFNNHASYARLLALQKRRRVSLPGSLRLIEANCALECADYGVVLGNAVTATSYQYAGKRLFTLNVPAAIEFPPPDAKDFSACRERFLWFGSSSMVHKGLDLVLEAFARMPELHLTICGPVSAERDFEQAYRRELYETANIHTIGWVHVSGAEFARVLSDSVAVVYPSCAEGQAGSVVTCLRAGLLPVVSRQSGLDVADFGWLLHEASIEDICRTVRSIAALPPAELAARSRRAWEHAQRYHSHDAYLRDYGRIAQEIIADAQRSRGARS